MSPYLLVYIYVVLVACASWRLKQNVVHNLYIITMLLLCSFLALHYGQGSDYFAYEKTFNYLQTIPNLSMLLHAIENMHGEILWHGISWLLGKLNINFQIFIIILALLEFYELHLYINSFCQHNKLWAILLIFPTIYLTFMFGAIRQGLVICTFMGYMLPFLIRKEIIKYYICATIMMLIHSTAIVLFVIPILVQLKLNVLYVGILAAIVIGFHIDSSFFQKITIFLPFMKNIVSNIVLRMGEYTIFLPAICERTFMFLFITYLYYKRQEKNLYVDNVFYKIYIYTIIIYCIFLNYSLTASRLSFTPRCVELALIIHYIEKLPNMRKLICYIVLVLNIVMCCKNLNAYVLQGGYKNIDFWRYPYVTIFNKNKIFQYGIKM